MGKIRLKKASESLVNTVVSLGSSMVEQLTLNQLVFGSSPNRGTTFNIASLHLLAPNTRHLSFHRTIPRAAGASAHRDAGGAHGIGAGCVYSAFQKR